MPPQPKTTKGTIDKTPCPFCGKGLDFREEKQAQLLDVECDYECDHCHNFVRTVGLRDVTVITLSQSPRNHELMVKAARKR